MATEQTIPALLRRRAQQTPDQLFAVCGDGALSFSAAEKAAGRLAAALAERGVGPGDRVALLLPNRPEMVESILGLAVLGAIQVPLNVFLKGQFLQYQLADSGASTLITDRAGLQAVRALESVPALQRIVLIGDGGDEEDGDVLDYGALADTGRSHSPEPLEPTAPAAILYTSGTTGFPKGCIASHAYYLHVGRSWAEILGATTTDVLFTALPLYHMGGQGHCLMLALALGCSVVFEPQFSASTFIARAGEVGATLAMGAGPMAAAMLATPPGGSDREHAVRLGAFGPLNPAAQLAFQERFGIDVLAELFAQSECTPIAFSPRVGNRRRDSAGRPAPWHEVRVVDEHDAEVSAGEAGEIVVRPRVPNAMFSSYWGKPEETVRTFRNLWHHTGDLGRVDDAGYLHYVDRKKDAVRRRGENIASIELETAIAGLPEIREAAVHAVASPLGEDDVKACLVLHDDAEVEPTQLFGFFRSALPYYAIPRYVEIMAELPKTAFGRVQKHLLRERGVTEKTWDFEALGLVLERSERR